MDLNSTGKSVVLYSEAHWQAVLSDWAIELLLPISHLTDINVPAGLLQVASQSNIS